MILISCLLAVCATSNWIIYPYEDIKTCIHTSVHVKESFSELVKNCINIRIYWYNYNIFMFMLSML